MIVKKKKKPKKISRVSFSGSVWVMGPSLNQSVWPEDIMQGLARLRSRPPWSPVTEGGISLSPNTGMENKEEWFPRKIKVAFPEKGAMDTCTQK